jgi:glycosyltransferase involved in cell wall biosynthesis
MRRRVGSLSTIAATNGDPAPAAGEIVRIIWISDSAPAGLTTDTGYFERHPQASLRFRVGIPARALATVGVESAYVGLDTPAVLGHLTPDNVDAVVFSKLSTPRGPAFDLFATAYLGTADHARARGLGVVVDLVDNVFATDRSDFFAALLARADAVTVATEALAEVCTHHSQAPVHVVEDPVEGERRPPRFAPPRAGLLARIGLGPAAARPLRLLWFGGQYRTFRDLAGLFPALCEFARKQPIELSVITGVDQRIAHELETLRAHAPRTFTARFAAWSLEAVAEGLEACDLVLLPADLKDAMRTTASANRLARALWAGRAVIAHPLPSYVDFRDAALLHANLIDALQWALADPAEVDRRIHVGQELVASRLSPEAIAGRWREVLGSLRSR